MRGMKSKNKNKNTGTKTYKMANKVFLARKPDGIVLIWLSSKSLKEEKME